MKINFESDIKATYLNITSKPNESEISEGILDAIGKQGNFFNANDGNLYSEYKDMLDAYNYYSKVRIQNFLEEKVDKEVNFIFTYLKNEDERDESSSIIVPLLYEVRENSKSETYTGCTEKLLGHVIQFKAEMRTYQTLLSEKGPSKELDDMYYDIRKRAKSHQIYRINSLDQIIIFEDFVGTGRSLIYKFLLRGEIFNKLIKLKSLRVKLVFLFLEISEEAKRKLDQFLLFNELNDTIFYQVPNDTGSFRTYNGNYSKLAEKLNLKESPYSLKALVSTYIETPNNTISLFWKGNQNNWQPLFPRTNKSVLVRSEELEPLRKILEEYDFRKSWGIPFIEPKIKNVSPKVNLMILMLLKYFEEKKCEWSTALKEISRVTNISAGSCSEIFDALRRANYIKLNGDYSIIELTKLGKNTILGVKSIPKIDDFIDETVLLN